MWCINRVLLFAVFLSATLCMGCNNSAIANTHIVERADSTSTSGHFEEIFCDPLEVYPQFIGGTEILIHYVNANLKYPEEAGDAEGRVIVQFYVLPSGNIDSVKVAKKINPYLDAEAVRIASSLPKFIPGKRDGRPAGFWFTLPVIFNKEKYRKLHSKRYQAYMVKNKADSVKEGMYRIVNDSGRIGYADMDGNTVIYPQFSYCYPFENGIAKVTYQYFYCNPPDSQEISDRRGAWFYIDKTGRRIE